MKKALAIDQQDEDFSLDYSYQLLHEYCEKRVIPKIIEKNITIATVETTTCGLLSDLLTGVSGASRYFILGIIPYSKNSKIKLGIPKRMLTHDGPGTVSKETAAELSKKVREFSNATVGIAETGLIQSNELLKRRTKKKAGLVFVSISKENYSLEKKLDIQTNVSRMVMRHEIVFRIMLQLIYFLET